jgi:hypothetical protein
VIIGTPTFIKAMIPSKLKRFCHKKFVISNVRSNLSWWSNVTVFGYKTDQEFLVKLKPCGQVVSILVERHFPYTTIDSCGLCFAFTLKNR